MDDAVWTPTTFTKNRDRFLAGDIAQALFAQVVAAAREARLMSDDHFTVDGTLLEAAAGLKSFRETGVQKPPPDDPGNPTVDFHGERRSNATHQSTTDPEGPAAEATGKEAKLQYLGGLLMENRHGLVVTTAVVGAGPRSARWRSPRWRRCLAARRRSAATKATINERSSTPCGRRGHPPRRREGATQRHRWADDAPSGLRGQSADAKRIEEVFGWMKTVGLLRKLRHRSVARVKGIFVFTAAAYNLVRLRTLAARPCLRARQPAAPRGAGRPGMGIPEPAPTSIA